MRHQTRNGLFTFQPLVVLLWLSIGMGLILEDRVAKNKYRRDRGLIHISYDSKPTYGCAPTKHCSHFLGCLKQVDASTKWYRKELSALSLSIYPHNLPRPIEDVPQQQQEQSTNRRVSPVFGPAGFYGGIGSMVTAKILFHTISRV